MTTPWILATTGLRYWRRDKPAKGPCPKRVLAKLLNLNPVSATMSVSRRRRPDEVNGELGRVFFLRSEESIYFEKNFLYVTVPKAPKKGKSLRTDGAGQRVVLRFMHRDVPHSLKCRTKGYVRFLPEIADSLDMECEVTETRSQSDVVRPLDHMREEDGLKIELVDHCSGGVLVESSPELLATLLEDRCPEWADGDDFEGAAWRDGFQRLAEPLIHLTLYPRYFYPDSLAEFRPNLPPRINVLARVERTYRRTELHAPILQHGLKFLFDQDTYMIGPEDVGHWSLRG